MINIKYWLYRKFNKDGLPHPNEIADIFWNETARLELVRNNVVVISAFRYGCMAMTLEEVVKTNFVTFMTRERVRQYVLKFYFDHKYKRGIFRND